MTGKYAHLESLDLICDHKDHFEEWVKGVSSFFNVVKRNYHILHRRKKIVDVLFLN